MPTILQPAMRTLMNQLAWPILLCFLYVNPLSAQVPGDYALRGTLLTHGGIVNDGIVVVRGGKIVSAGPDAGADHKATVIDTHAIIAPGLIDLHNHLTYNVFPRWHPIEEFSNRYDWQQKQIYKTLIESPHKTLVADGLECEMERYAEVKAITEGETSLVGSLQDACSAGLAHNLDTEASWHVAYNVFPLQMTEDELTPIRQQLAGHQLRAFLIHLSEGGHDDASAAREFTMLKGRGLLVPGVALIHGVALQPQDFPEMAQHGVSLIWSPRSNLELYGNTADVASAKAAGVRIALAPDWSPSGSDGLLAELNYASAWDEIQHPRVFSDRELFSMATSGAADIIGAGDHLGALLPGYDADLLVVRPEADPTKHDAWWALTHATAGQVTLVTIAGAPVYGDSELLADLAPGHSAEKLEICGNSKAVLFSGKHGDVDAADETWAQSAATLEKALRHYGRNLAPLAECGQ